MTVVLRRTALVAACIVFLTSIVACGGKQTEKDDSAVQKPKDNPDALHVAVMPTLDCLPIFVAYEHGFFQSQQTEVSLKLYMAQMDCDEALKKNKVEMMVSDLMRTERLKNHGTDLTYITATNAYWQLICNKNARVTKVDQLADKMMGISRYSATDYLGTLAVDSAKPKYPVFRIQVNDVGIRLNMLLNKELDAVILTEPQATVAKMVNHKVLADSRYNDISLGVIAMRSDVLNNPLRQRQRDAFVKAYDQACDSINEKGMAHYAKIVKKYCHIDDKTVKALPKLIYKHTAQPRQVDIDRTKNVKWKTF